MVWTRYKRNINSRKLNQLIASCDFPKVYEIGVEVLYIYKKKNKLHSSINLFISSR